MSPPSSRNTIVSPPPGVSSISTSPPIASTKPFATARPSPTPVAARRRRRVAGTGGRPGRDRPAARPARDRRRGRRRASPAAPATTRTGLPGGLWLRALMITFASARSSSPGSASTRGCVSSTSTSTSRGAGADARERCRDRPRRPRRRSRLTSSAPVCSRLMSSRLPTSALRRSDSSSIVTRNSCRASGVHSTSSWRRLVTDALIPESGVRRSCETAERIAVRSVAGGGEGAGLGCLRLELLERDRGRDLARERLQDPIVRARFDRTPREGEDMDVVELDLPSRRALRHGRSDAVVERPAGVGSVEHGARRRARGSGAEPSRSTGTGAAPARPASASASARARAPSAARRAASETKVLMTAATARKTESARRFSPCSMVNVWIGGVKYQLTSRNADHRCRERGPDAADR